jgi:hypothetical protein
VSKRKYEEPVGLNMKFGEALQRFAQTKPHEVARLMKESKDGRVCESDLVLPALRFMAERKNGLITTADLIAELEALFNPTGKDAEIIEGRSDTHFSQKVRNLVSHKKNNFIAEGYAKHITNLHALQITDAGKELLKKLGG